MRDNQHVTFVRSFRVPESPIRWGQWGFPSRRQLVLTNVSTSTASGRTSSLHGLHQNCLSAFVAKCYTNSATHNDDTKTSPSACDRCNTSCQ